MECRVCKNRVAFIDNKGREIAGYHLEFKNKLGFWCKYRSVPDWSPSPGTPFVVTYVTRKSAEHVMKEVQNGTKCNEGISMIGVTVIVSLLVTVLALSVITLLQSNG